MKIGFLVSVLLLFSQSAFSDVVALSKPYANSCGYYSSLGVQLEVFLNDPHLPEDAEVNLVYGLGSKKQNRDWDQRTVVPTLKVNQSNTRQAKVTVALSARSHPITYDIFQFVWEVRLPIGRTYYINGGKSPWGCYEADVSSSTVYACSPATQFAPLNLRTR